MSDMMIRSHTTSPGVSGSANLIQLRGTRQGDLFTADWLVDLALQGRVFYGSGSTASTAVTGQTSFANTTPTFLLDVPANTVAVPLWVNLVQSGSVAGGVVTVHIEIDDATRYASGGTTETVLSSRTDAPFTKACTFYSNPTASAGRGISVANYVLGQDVSPAEGAPNGLFWTPAAPIFIVGTGSFNVFTYAGTTGPTWLYSIAWAELPVGAVTQ